ncbi:Formate/nitrite transporter FocA, FNT family [Halogranum amylolyticum]|uniref:Formate/nitrite transporter FocA, FNT family n=1 Tax=Halogranum amylolyticum TaxID=660520 RepID=A0A1H8W6U2_9EURY|nr:formate/nitrite transporter family protein [Halogranum amylolyticum]SEP23374.1 Formate/nitrite transporter FocA, FNT family [Halogranum amylolyticum]
MPSDEPQGASLSYNKILERELENALREINRPPKGVFLSGIAAGLNVSFGALFMGMALTFSPSFPSPLVKQVTLALLSSIGFLFVVLGQTELFTAHTTMAVLPVLDGRTGVRELGRLWGNVYVSNLIGCGAFAVFVAGFGPAFGIVTPAAAESLATALVRHPWWVILLSGVVAGWLMGLMTWLVAATRDTVSRVFIIIIVAATIGLAPFHHALLGTTEVLMGLFLSPLVTVADYGHFLLWTTIGNALGGSVLVALVNYGHVRLAGEAVDVEFESSVDEEPDG